MSLNLPLRALQLSVKAKLLLALQVNLRNLFDRVV